MWEREPHLDRDCLLTGRLTLKVRGRGTPVRKRHTVEIRGCGFV